MLINFPLSSKEKVDWGNWNLVHISLKRFKLIRFKELYSCVKRMYSASLNSFYLRYWIIIQPKTDRLSVFIWTERSDNVYVGINRVLTHLFKKQTI